ncbi:hypothetical protein CEUSTIGMA_g12103.t1 [Chlamydomonas eustigma]|uniref:Uncharacterized protein n=1 Tax=Chlamydomonas eustigma TaxID=1157962 RepID=A0A250XP24_9CHLO|nr:hypothetical protein CEUSTIGMA_g12103.t1 [Chlamydomonas eustigma]|eukprot:GAX84682.1 hypothetical protein CEUSTIGMA_g12103.t1 [Chlamydomonas eustigma]
MVPWTPWMMPEDRTNRHCDPCHTSWLESHEKNTHIPTRRPEPRQQPPPNRHSKEKCMQEAKEAEEALTASFTGRQKAMTNKQLWNVNQGSSIMFAGTRRVVTLGTIRQWRPFGALQRMEISTRWCELQQEMEALTVQVRSDYNTGHLLSMQPYRKITFHLPTLEALEISEVAVWEQVDLESHLAESPHLRMATLTELWTLMPLSNASYTMPPPSIPVAKNTTHHVSSMSSEPSSQSVHSPTSAVTSTPSTPLLSPSASMPVSPLKKAVSVDFNSELKTQRLISLKARSSSSAVSDIHLLPLLGSSNYDKYLEEKSTSLFHSAGDQQLIQEQMDSPVEVHQAPKLSVTLDDPDPVTCSCYVYHLSLPSCRLLYIRNTLNCIGFEVWAPQMQSMHLLCTRLGRVRLLTPLKSSSPVTSRVDPKPSHVKEEDINFSRNPEQAPGKALARVTMLRDSVDAESLMLLRRHPQVGELFWDDIAAESMQQGLQSLKQVMMTAWGPDVMVGAAKTKDDILIP